MCPTHPGAIVNLEPAAEWEMAQWGKLDCSDSMDDIERMSNLDEPEASPGCVALEDKCSFLLE